MRELVLDAGDSDISWGAAAMYARPSSSSFVRETEYYYFFSRAGTPFKQVRGRAAGMAGRMRPPRQRQQSSQGVKTKK